MNLNEFVDAFLLPCFWLLNGMLVALYALSEHLELVILIPSLGWLYSLLNRFESRQRKAFLPVFAGTATLTLAGVLTAPPPAPFLLAGLTGVSAIAVCLEQYRPDETFWAALQGLILYSLVGLGAWLIQTWLMKTTDSLAGAGSEYLSALVAAALWIMPVAQATLLIKNLLAHAPVGSDTQTIIQNARERRS
jgi:hypothetical protein